MEASTLWQGALHEAGWLIGWALIHLLWQGAVLGVVHAAGRALLPRGEARYRFGMGLLFAFGLCPLLTVWRLWPHAAAAVATARDLAAPAAITPPSGWSLLAAPGLDADRALPWLVTGWACGVLLLSLRAWWQWRGLKTLCDRAAELAPWPALAAAMARRFGLRRVRVLCSGQVAAPLLLGWLKPVILLPLSMVCQLPAAQVELILAHELAHLRRWDPLANLFQVILETLYFFHPVLHWISRDVRNEREICCDRLALEVTGGSRQQLARALAGLCELNERPAPWVLAAHGGVLLDRLQQLAFERPVSPPRPAGRLARFAAVMLGAAIALATVGIEWNLALLQRHLLDSLQRLQSNALPAWSPLLDTFRLSLAHDLVVTHAGVLRVAPLRVAVPAVEPSPGADALPALPSPIRWDAAPPRISDLVPRRQLPAVTPLPAVRAAASPRPVQMRQPAYPRQALESGIEGSVLLEFGLAADGSVANVQVVDAQPAGVFDAAALEAFGHWKFEAPPSAAPARYRQQLSFTLHDGQGDAGSRGQGRARVGCHVATGTHICRSPEDPRMLPGRSRE